MSANKAAIVFRPADGCRLTQRAIDIIGPELLRLAQAFKVDVAQLTTRQVHDALEKDKSNPLWAFIDTDSSKALYQWVHEQVGALIRNVRYDRVEIPLVRPLALFVSVKDTSLRGGGGTGRAKVCALEVYNNPGLATRIADENVIRIRQAVDALNDSVAIYPVPTRYKDLAADLKLRLTQFNLVSLALPIVMKPPATPTAHPVGKTTAKPGIARTRPSPARSTPKRRRGRDQSNGPQPTP